MPGISGAALARRVREIHPGRRVLFISGYPVCRPRAASVCGTLSCFAVLALLLASLGFERRALVLDRTANQEPHGSSANNLLADWKIEVGAVADFAATLAPSR